MAGRGVVQDQQQCFFKFSGGSGLGGGVTGFTDGILNLGAMSRRPRGSALEAGIDSIPFAEEQVAVVTSLDLSLPQLTVELVRAIITGEIDKWSSVGGSDARIRLIFREGDENNSRIVRAGSPGDPPFSKAAVVLTSETTAEDPLNNETNAFGYLAYSGVVASGLSGNPVAQNGLHRTDNEVDHPLPPRSLAAAYSSEDPDEIKGSVDFRGGSLVQEISVEQGLLAIK